MDGRRSSTGDAAKSTCRTFGVCGERVMGKKGKTGLEGAIK